MSNIYGRQVVEALTNKSGGSVVAGDVVIIDTSNDTAFTTTTTGQYTGTIGIAQEAIANNATGRVLLSGYAALINVPSSVTRGHFIQTHTVAKQATGNSTRQQGSFGQFRTGGTTPTGTVWGKADATSGSVTLTTVDATLGADVTMTTANTGYDGPSASFAAGTWLVFAQALVVATNTSATHDVTMRVWDATTSYLEASQGRAPADTSQIGISLSAGGIVVLGSPATLKITVYDVRNGSTLKRDVVNNGATTHTATRLVGYKVS